MTQYLIKVIVSALLIVGVSEVSKRSSVMGALLASLPLISLLSFIWIYVDTKDVQLLASLSKEVFWMVLPSLLLFLTLPVLLQKGMDFWVSLLISCGWTALVYGIFLKFYLR